MKAPLQIDELHLLNFFSAIPVQLDPNLPWIYNDSSYEAVEGQTRISFAIAPASRDVRIRLTEGDALRYEFNAMGIEDVRVHNDKGCESLEMTLAGTSSLWILLKPSISIRQHFCKDHRNDVEVNLR